MLFVIRDKSIGSALNLPGKENVMAYIKYQGSEELIKASVLPMRPTVVRIITDTEPALTGFKLYLDKDGSYPLDNGEYEACTTLYRKGEGWFELSSDGSVYKEVAPVQPEELTEEELAALERKKQVAYICSQIASLEAQIQSTDYQIIKTYEYSLVGKETEYDIEALHETRQSLRDQINELEMQLAALTTTE